MNQSITLGSEAVTVQKHMLIFSCLYICFKTFQNWRDLYSMTHLGSQRIR